jgi:hypothetical protein
MQVDKPSINGNSVIKKFQDGQPPAPTMDKHRHPDFCFAKKKTSRLLYMVILKL